MKCCTPVIQLVTDGAVVGLQGPALHHYPSCITRDPVGSRSVSAGAGFYVSTQESQLTRMGRGVEQGRLPAGGTHDLSLWRQSRAGEG